jgi:hypothetical protein
MDLRHLAITVNEDYPGTSVISILVLFGSGGIEPPAGNAFPCIYSRDACMTITPLG